MGPGNQKEKKRPEGGPGQRGTSVPFALRILVRTGDIK